MTVFADAQQWIVNVFYAQVLIIQSVQLIAKWQTLVSGVNVRPHVETEQKQGT